MPKVHDTSASGPDGSLLSVQLGLTIPVRQPPADLLAAIGTRRRPVRAIPVIEARRDGSQLYFRCRYCRRRHYHGVHTSLCPPECPCPKHDSLFRREPCWCPVGTGDGHRGAHCQNPRSPYKATGYYLREMTG